MGHSWDSRLKNLIAEAIVNRFEVVLGMNVDGSLYLKINYLRLIWLNYSFLLLYFAKLLGLNIYKNKKNSPL